MLFKDKLKGRREEVGMTQEDVAKKAGVPLWTLRGYEQGKRDRVTLPVAVKLAKVLGVTCEYFADCEDVAGAEDKPAPKKKAKRK